MNSFWKTVLAVIVGTLCVSIISCLFTTCVFVGMIASSSSADKAVSTKEGDVMLLKINGPVTEIPASMPFAFDILGGITKNQELSLRGYLNAIACAKADPNIAGIYLNTDGMSAAPASYEAIHDALVDFRAPRHPVCQGNPERRRHCQRGLHHHFGRFLCRCLTYVCHWEDLNP